MLYDKRWDKEVKADPLSIEALASWLETRDPDEKYDYENCSGRCLYGQYMATLGFSWPKSGACGAYLSDTARSEFCNLVYDRVASETPWTFGAALDRARAALTRV